MKQGFEERWNEAKARFAGLEAETSTRT